MKNEDKLRDLIQKIIQEELQLEKAPKMKEHPGQKGLSNVHSQLQNVGRTIPTNIYSKKVHQKITVALKAIRAAMDALRSVPQSFD